MFRRRNTKVEKSKRFRRESVLLRLFLWLFSSSAHTLPHPTCPFLHLPSRLFIRLCNSPLYSTTFASSVQSPFFLMLAFLPFLLSFFQLLSSLSLSSPLALSPRALSVDVWHVGDGLRELCTEAAEWRWTGENGIKKAKWIKRWETADRTIRLCDLVAYYTLPNIPTSANYHTCSHKHTLRHPT